MADCYPVQFHRGVVSDRVREGEAAEAGDEDDGNARRHLLAVILHLQHDCRCSVFPSVDCVCLLIAMFDSDDVCAVVVTSSGSSSST